MAKRARTGLDSAIVNVWKREVGELSSRNFAHKLRASENLVLRLDIFRKLEKHRGCVNTISFNADGDILISGSDDRRVILWDWESGDVKLTFHSGHHGNVFQAKTMPYTDDRSIVTCAADGQVRHAQISDGGEVKTKTLATHQGRAHKLAIEPGSPHIFYTCGEDGLVQHIDLRTGASTELFTCQPIWDKSYMSVIHLNAIAIDPRNPNLFAVAGSDEYARLFDIRKYKWDGSSEFGHPVDFFCPHHLIGDAHVGITGLAFSDQSELLVSYNDEFIYLFSRDMGLGPEPVTSSAASVDSDEDKSEPDQQSSDMDSDTKVGARPQAYKGHRNCETVKGVNFFGPKCEYVVSGSDCGRIFIWKKKGGELIRVMEADKHVVNCIESHPHTTMLASSGIESDIKIWTPKALDRAKLPANIEKVRVADRYSFLAFDDIAYSDFSDDNDDDYFYDDDCDDDAISDSDSSGDGDDGDEEEEEDYYDEDNEDDCYDDDGGGGAHGSDDDEYDEVSDDENDILDYADDYGEGADNGHDLAPAEGDNSDEGGSEFYESVENGDCNDIFHDFDNENEDFSNFEKCDDYGFDNIDDE